MYMLFEHIWDYENSQINVICVSEDKKNITNILSKYKFGRVFEFVERVIYDLEDKEFILMYILKDNYLKKEVVI